MKWLPSSWFFALLKAIKNWMVKVCGNDGTRHNTVQWKTFEGENFRELVKNMLCMDCSLLQRQRCHAPKFCREKLSQIATKLWNSRKFSLSKVSRYMVLQSDFHAERYMGTYTHTKRLCTWITSSTLRTSSETSPGLCNRDALMYWNTSAMPSTLILSSWE